MSWAGSAADGGRSVGRVNDPSRLARLNAIKLQALVRDHLGGEVEFEPGEFASGAALVHGPSAWVLLSERPERGLGAALAWALRHGAQELHVVAETHTGMLARRAAGFTIPVTVWRADGRVLHRAEPEPLPVPPAVPAGHLAFEPAIVQSGATPNEEFGVLVGEVAGLEVCRVVDDPWLHVTRLEVGVGAHDREAFLALHGDRPTAEALAEVVAFVIEHRLGPDHGHPLRRLGAERLLRHELVTDPSPIGASSLRAVAPPVPRPNLKDPVPCVAVADIGGEQVAVVCSVGIDLDVVPFAVDTCAALGLGRCLVVVPHRDAIDVQHRIAAAARAAVTVVAVDRP